MANLLCSLFMDKPYTIDSQHPAEAPWLQKNIKGNTPLHDALELRNDLIGCILLEFDTGILLYTVNMYGESPLYLAVKGDCPRVVAEILKKLASPTNLIDKNLLMSGPREQTPLHMAFKLSAISLNVVLVNTLHEYLKNRDINGCTALHYAAGEGSTELVELLLEKDASLTYLTNNDELNPLFLACTFGRLDNIRAIIKHCPDCTVAVSTLFVSTALHHVKFTSLREYHMLLELPEIEVLKNEKDEYSRTPLHKAIHDGNFFLAKALLSTEYVDYSIKDYHDKTALDWLKECAEESPAWAELCYQFGILQRPSTFVPQNTYLKEVRSTLAVVAALLVTITFAAGFTIPGGFDSGNGTAVLGKKAAFIVFMLSDAYAMSCSMVSLFSLIMVWNSKKPMELTDLSVYGLYQSLYGTVVAFISGIYAMESHKSLWLAVVVCVICSFVPILVSWGMVDSFCDRLVAARKYKKMVSRVQRFHGV